jgi:lipopolysaccharide export system ATP-binding protein
MTTGLIVPNEGHIYLNDKDITSYPVYKRAQNGIGYLAQEASVFRKMSVEDNIASVLELTNKSPEYQKEKLESLIAEFRLQKVRKNLGDQLSGGERRRTEIARCLAIDPKFIMLDEPFAGVDPIAVEDCTSAVSKTPVNSPCSQVRVQASSMRSSARPAASLRPSVSMVIPSRNNPRPPSRETNSVP